MNELFEEWIHVMMDGWIRLIVGFQPLMVIIHVMKCLKNELLGRRNSRSDHFKRLSLWLKISACLCKMWLNCSVTALDQYNSLWNGSGNAGHWSRRSSFLLSVFCVFLWYMNNYFFLQYFHILDIMDQVFMQSKQAVNKLIGCWPLWQTHEVWGNNFYL